VVDGDPRDGAAAALGAASAGFALAAEVAGDRGAARAAGALAPDRADAWLFEARALAAVDPAVRTTRLRALAAAAAAPPGPMAAGEAPGPGHLAPAAPPSAFDGLVLARARALVAAQMPPVLRARWLAEAPPVRRGYVPTAGLRRLLRDALAQGASEGAAARSMR
jgi:hypothetical protein